MLPTTTACAATVTALKYQDLEVPASETLFLDAVSPDQKTAGVEVKNTSDWEAELGTDMTRHLDPVPLLR